MKNEIIGQITKSLQKLVRIPSKFSTPKKGAPRGKYIKKALHTCVRIGKKIGFSEGGVIDGMVAWLDVGEGEEEFAVLCHVDVVPEGDGWSKKPYSGEILDGRIYGRGTADDKGPMVCAMYAISSLIKEGKTPTKKIRFIIGGDEEGFPKTDNPFALNDIDSIDVYKKRRPLPKIGFSPDAEFPVIYAEKGILHLELSIETNGDITNLNGGERANVVPNFASAEISGERVCAKGISAHGSTPEKGKNAIIELLNIASAKSDFAKKLYRLFAFTDGSGLGIDCKDIESGALSMNVGVVRTVNDNFVFTLDIRYPVTRKKDEIIQQIKSVWQGELKEIRHEKPLFVPKEDSLIKNLLESYQEVTGDKSEPIAIGGGTYARKLEKGVAFGALFPSQEDRMHMADEYVSIENIEKTYLIYKKAIEKLCF